MVIFQDEPMCVVATAAAAAAAAPAVSLNVTQLLGTEPTAAPAAAVLLPQLLVVTLIYDR